jgi:asparaginyl-tRNA synthetase
VTIALNAKSEVELSRHDAWSRPGRFTDIISDPWYGLLIKLQHVVSSATFDFWRGKGASTIHLPITTNAISSPMGLGSDSLPVEIDLFNQRTYLADSMQFMLEYGCRFNSKGCFYLMPSFRGEDADETHLCQFYHSEVELICGLDEAMDVAEQYFRFMSQAVLDGCASDLVAEAGGIAHIEEVLKLQHYPRLDFEEAAVRLKNDPKFIRHEQGWRSISRAGEQELLRQLQAPAWVSHWDHLAVPFYQGLAAGSGKALNADFLLGMGEVIGLGERHTTAEEVRSALALHQVAEDPYQWYIDMKRLYPMRTAGFGMGVERFLLWILKHEDIRDLQILPRFNGISIVP